MEYRRFIDPFKKWWWLILISTLLAGGISFYVSGQQPPIYQTHATLIVGQPINDPNPTGSDLATGQQLAVTYADIGMREPVRRAVAEKLDLEPPVQYSVIALPRTQLIEVNVTNQNPQKAQAIANAVAEELVALSPSTLDPQEQERIEFVSEQLTNLQNRIEETEEELTAKQDELATLFNAQELAEAQNEVAALELKLNTLQGNYASLLASTQEDAVNVVSIVEAANLPRVPVNSQRYVTILVAASVGFFMAVAAAYLMEFLDQSIQSTEDIARVTEVKTLVTIPRISKFRYKSELIALEYPYSTIAEVFRSLRTILRTNYIDEKPGYVFLITSPKRSDGKSFVTANLAIICARAGLRTLLIDANLHRSTQHIKFELSNQNGLSNYLAPADDGNSQWTNGNLTEQFSLMSNHSISNLDIVTSGNNVDYAAEKLGSNQMMVLLGEAKKQNYDVIFVDSPPFLHLSDALSICRFADGVLLVVRAGKTNPDELSDAIGILNEVGANLVGIVLNRAAPVKGGYFYGRPYRNLSKKKQQKVDGFKPISKSNIEA